MLLFLLGLYVGCAIVFGLTIYNRMKLDGVEDKLLAKAAATIIGLCWPYHLIHNHFRREES